MLCSTGNTTEPLYTDASFTGNSPDRVWMQLCFTGNDVAEARGSRVPRGQPSHRGRASSGGSGHITVHVLLIGRERTEPISEHVGRRRVAGHRWAYRTRFT
ncbi:hypothetical protein GCM10028787_09890 [Brachybacterium horti]